MTKIIVIGNSHLASVKLAWDNLENEFAEHSLDFFGLGGRMFDRVVLDSELNYALRDGVRDMLTERVTRLYGRTSVNLRDYDVVLRVGHGVCDGLMRSFVCHNNIGSDLDLGYKTTVSVKFYKDAISKTMVSNFIDPIWSNWGSDAPQLYIHPRPTVCEDIAIHSKGKASGWKKFLKLPPQIVLAKRLMEDSLSETFHAHNARFLGAPVITENLIGLTKREYSQGAVRLDTTREDRVSLEVNHMNDKYGELVLREFFQKLGDDKLD